MRRAMLLIARRIAFQAPAAAEALGGGSHTVAARGAVGNMVKKDVRILSLGNKLMSTQASGAHRRGPVSFVSLGLTLLTGAGLLYYYNQRKEKKLQEIMHNTNASVGQAQIGGPFQLVNQDGKKFTNEDLLGEFALLYFGFTHCPDICPDELEKMANGLDMIEKEIGAQIQPVFISVDPERDTPKKMKSYAAEFHPRLIGLTGTSEQVKSAARAYRVYYSKTESDDENYLVDHSMITYLLNPDGQFVTYYGKNTTSSELSKSVIDHVRNWANDHTEYDGLRKDKNGSKTKKEIQ